MRIAVWHNLPSGGGKRALYYHVRGLLRRGHQVEAWCPPTADQQYLPLRELIPEHQVPLETGPLPPIAAGDTQPRRDHYRQTRQYVEAFHAHCRAVAEAIDRGGFDLVFANSCWMSAVSPLGQYVQSPSLLYLQEPQRWLYEAVPPLPGLPWVDVKLWGRHWWTPQRLRHFAAETIRVQCLRIVARAELDNLRSYDRVLVNSYFSRESLLRSFNVDARVCYLGIDTDLFQALDGPREDLVVGLGAFGRHKNIELAIRAIGALPEPRPTLAWVGNSGEPEYIRSLEELAREQGVRFEIRRLVGDAELVDLMNRAALMLYTSRLEPFGFAPLEANACGLPVVAVAEGGVRETIIDGVNGLLADADPETLAAAVQRLRTDPDLARRLGRQGRERVLSEWGLEPSIDRLEAQFRKLLS